MVYNMNGWKFDEAIVKIFDEHVRKSVPMYELFHSNIIDMSKYFIKKNTSIIDLGTSTGYFINAIHDEGLGRGNKFIGVDIEKAMIDECKERYKSKDIEFIHNSAIDIDYSNASVITMILLLQFMEKEERIKLLKKIYDEIETGTALFVVEKIKTQNLDIHDIYNDLYYDFKRNMGLTDTEIIDKNVSLRGMMKPLEISEVMQIFKDIGFKVDISVKFNNFISIIAVK